MDGHPDNPFESPRTDPTSADRTRRRVSVWVAAPLTLIASCAAFCGACYPAGLGAFSVTYSMSNSGLAQLIWLLPWVLGTIAAVLVGKLLWWSMRGRSES